MIDLHAHVLPGIDDGASDWEEALAIVEVACENGITAMVATSHQHADGPYQNANNKVLDLLQEMQKRVNVAGLPITLHAGGEVLISPDVVERVDSGSAMLYEGGKYILLEFPSSEAPAYAREVVFELIVKGITPVIAHPERNQQLARNPELLYELVEAGALAQLTASSISSRVDPALRETAALFLMHNLVHVMASDAHSTTRRPPVLDRYARRIGGVLGEQKAMDLVQNVPAAILRGEAIEVPSPVPFTKKSRREAAHIAKELAAETNGNARRGLANFFRLPWLPN